ncbi:hypothetical protein, partial [Streptomyces virginiae]|uniref:hypothetical protein n=1 Tax=Streptomyces virginiae TaxID=1961 RepID=UPI0035DDFDEB
MAEAVPVRCPACLRENGYTAPVFPCACGSPVNPPLDLSAPPVLLTHRTWSDSWVAVRCTTCGRESEWPHPELGCGSCGTVVRLPVHPLERPESGTGPGTGRGAGPGAAGAADRAARRGEGPADAGAGATGDAVGDGRAGGAGGGGPVGVRPAMDPAHIPTPPNTVVPQPSFRS